MQFQGCWQPSIGTIFQLDLQSVNLKKLFSPLDIASCAKHPIQWQNDVAFFWHKLHFANKIVYLKKQLKRNMQFPHTVALLSIYATKITQRKSTFVNDYKSV